MIKSLQRLIPNKVTIEADLEEGIDNEIKEVDFEKQFINKSEKTIAHRNRIQLIKQVITEYKKTNNIKHTARVLKMSKNTVKRYIAMNDIEKESAYDTGIRSSQLDPYKDIIIERFNSCGNFEEVYQFLLGEGINTNYWAVNRFINKWKSKSKKIVDKDKLIRKRITIINRRDIIKKVFGWNCNDDNVTKHI